MGAIFGIQGDREVTMSLACDVKLLVQVSFR